MKDCPKCGRPIANEPACLWCGYGLAEGTVLKPEVAAAVAIEPPPADLSLSGQGPQAADATRPKQRVSPLLIAITVIGLGSLMLVASAMRSPAMPPEISPSAPSAKPGVEPARGSNHRATAAAIEPSGNPSTSRWSTSGPAHRGRTGPNDVTFELAANKDVPVWRNRVRPVLTVRCVAKTLEVFVMTHSAASVENSGLHTVKVSFDNRDAAPQTWEHSIDHDALFATDASALARQIAGARTMSFVFTPFNASPALVQFNVAGFETQLQSAAKNCAWKP